MSDMPSNVVRRGEPSRSAHWVAALRAAHQLLDEPLVLPDPIALPLLGASAEAALREDPFALNDPISRGVRAAMVARRLMAWRIHPAPVNVRVDSRGHVRST